MSVTQSIRKRRKGTVVSTRQMKTAVVEIESYKPHKLYGKIMQQKKRLFAHDKSEETAVGDFIEIEETRPLSKHKCWRVIKIIKKHNKKI